MDMKELWKHDVSLVMYLASIGVAFYKPSLSLLIVALVTVYMDCAERRRKAPRRAGLRTLKQTLLR